MTELAPKYNPQEVEAGRYQEWLDEDLFKPSGDKKAKPYSIVIPPPNVTGKLHLGHAWDTAIQDTLIRYKRMQGYDTLYLPGMDHAGIATQAKVEARLREQGVSRYDLGREKFVEKVWEWKDEYANIIKSQWQKLGLSLDYSRERFTLDKGLSKAVRRVFVQLYNEGLIYRGEYIINWDPKLRTALSDIEVVHQDDQGAFYHINYPLADGSGSVEIATTRPETMFGDTAVAVAPGDERYKDLVGKKLILPLVGREIPIIEDQHVDPEFGTGLVKITPAHDPNDFEVGNRHDLPRINVMNDDGTMNDKAGKYAGMDRFDCRKQLVEDLKAEGYLIKVEPIVHSVGHSERSGVQVEPRLSTQWFVKMKPLADKVLENQKGEGRVNFVPDRFEGTLERWMENVHDWVISRQLWWGHRIPAWYNKQTGEMYVGEEAPADIENWDQDQDVLDTWFSSALWPFSTLGWPDEDTADFKRYFPTNALVTGYDIIFFWVSRMIFQSLHFTGERPFDNVVLHGLIRDEQGRKMSKSLGNGIDPMDVIDKYGADALRWFLLNGTAPGQDTRFSYTKMDAAWNFINKLWNASRFVIMNLPEDAKPAQKPDTSKFDLADAWIFDRLNHTVKETNRLFDEFQFGEAGREMYNFIWNDFCDWYIEISKVALYGDDAELKARKQANLTWILDQILRLIHPIMPFVTEKLWLSMPHEGKSIMTAAYPEAHTEFDNAKADEDMAFLIEIIKAVRTIRMEVNAPMSSAIDILIQLDDEKNEAILRDNMEYVENFLHPKKLEISGKIKAPKLAKTAVIAGAQIFVPLSELVDLDEEIAKMGKEEARLEAEVDRASKKLANKGFVDHAPAAVVEKEKGKLAEYESQLAGVRDRIKELKESR
ncbi:Valyl-tRNA synthetase [Lactobacillus delbrueckii subsp. delbrueckii DSM 20074 = JCM 1012]|uniref:valine--tRNA ligase n=1 Tax=Lactobacillus delbrueckii TaxID=1584 RepID=UPI00069B7647|nr:valine--tRNA ligase [Lactobacillus delbrueckii]APP09497.1 valine--tRNA ligase [Lactobacillus delbrueckii subsp. delbrueckii DSM 20074 = JCM 1012]KNZ38348.1 valine--tRNA ligase [Lactobacillus delbrueckii subsp. delbrueckii]KRK27502.1 Valyl-tRNA synthetase [Lactobacillus delbrueckii subsp. delbrueckii DSM 20074 = JCM 1012]MCT3494035.1 valine--tRNA ligase [Lactobacillus delbrueckii]MCT3521254.1 valine--tRNA ligase [Lactobacillus delbrueckii]